MMGRPTPASETTTTTTPTNRIIGLDLDGVLFNFVDALHAECETLIGRPLPRYNRLTDDTTWDTPLKHGVTRADYDTVWRRINAAPGWFAKVPAYAWARPALDRLGVAEAVGRLDVYFITARSGVDAKQSSEKALEQLGFIGPTVLVVPKAEYKPQLINGLGITAFLEDKVSTIVEINRQCRNTTVYTFDQPWNRTSVIPRSSPRIIDINDFVRRVCD